MKEVVSLLCTAVLTVPDAYMRLFLLLVLLRRLGLLESISLWACIGTLADLLPR
jgi:hypothetical protein